MDDGNIRLVFYARQKFAGSVENVINSKIVGAATSFPAGLAKIVNAIDGNCNEVPCLKLLRN